MLTYLLALHPTPPKHERTALPDADPVGVACSDEHGQAMGWGCIESCPKHTPTWYALEMAQHRSDW